MEERVFILESYLKTMSYVNCRQSFFLNIINEYELNITRAIQEVNEGKLRKVARDMVKRVDKCIEMNGHIFQHLL